MLAVRPRLSELTPSALRQRAAEYRAMAETASTVEVRDSLLRIAGRLERRAWEHEPLGPTLDGQEPKA